MYFLPDLVQKYRVIIRPKSSFLKDNLPFFNKKYRKELNYFSEEPM